MVNLAINGVGRIGKLVLNLLISKNFKIKYLNDLNGDSASLLHSLEFDSIHGKWDCNFQADKNFIKINNETIKTSFSNDIDNLDLEKIDIVIDCTGANKNTSVFKLFKRYSTFNS